MADFGILLAGRTRPYVQCASETKRSLEGLRD
jgi:hypothetical protein